MKKVTKSRSAYIVKKSSIFKLLSIYFKPLNEQFVKSDGMSFELKFRVCGRFRRCPRALFLVVAAAVSSVGASEFREININDSSYRVELATTAAARQRGLMHRASLAADRGMLLVYPRDGEHAIWMKNMRVPLRVFWIDADYRVVAMRRLEPCRADPCPTYRPAVVSRYVLELSDRKHPIALGDRLSGLRTP